MIARRRLRVGIDARDLLVEQRTGVERVAYQFVDSLRRVGDPEHEYLFFFDRTPARDDLPEFPGKVVVEPARMQFLRWAGDVWLLLQARRFVAAHGLDAFYTLNSKLPLARTARITTVHGLEWHFCPADYRRSELVRQRLWFRLCTRYSTGIVTFAEATRRDMDELCPGCDVPVCVVPEGVDVRFRRTSDHAEAAAAVLDRFGIRRPFVLSVCSLEPRKNLEALVRAFARVAALPDVPHELVLVGRAGRDSKRLSDVIATHGLEQRVRRPGFVSDDDLVELYNQTDLFVYPSKYEGFGLPVVEAMACGAPVVTSRRGALVEVGGDAALLVDPTDDADLAGAIADTLRDPARRAAMREAGLRSARRFSWDEMTRRIVEFIDERARSR